MDGEVSNREAFRTATVAPGVKKGWVPRRAAGGGRGQAGSADGEGHVCTLVPGATAMFEVAATAPDKMIDGTVNMEVRLGGVGGQRRLS